MYPQYMCILPYVELILCNTISYLHCQLVWGGRCILSICAFCYMCNLFGVTFFHRCIVNWSLGGRCILSICLFYYIGNLFGVTVFDRSTVNWSVGECVLSICAFSYM